MVNTLKLPDIRVDGEVVSEIGHKHALIESKSHPGQHHVVTHEFNDDIGKEEWICTCEGFGFRHACRHVRALDRWAAGKAVVEGLVLEEDLDV